MKLKEYIAKLSEYDQDAEVLGKDDNNNYYMVGDIWSIGTIPVQTIKNNSLPESLIGKTVIVLQRKINTMEYDCNNEPEPGVRAYCEVCDFWHPQNEPCLCNEKTLTKDDIKSIYDSAQKALTILLNKAEQSNFEPPVDLMVVAELEYIINKTKSNG